MQPTQRLIKYTLLLAELAKQQQQLVSSGAAGKEQPQQGLQLAQRMLHDEIKFGNDLMALDALRDLPLEVRTTHRKHSTH